MGRIRCNKRGEKLMIGILFYSNLLPSVTFSFFAVLIYMKTGPGGGGVLLEFKKVFMDYYFVARAQRKFKELYGEV